MQSQEAVEAGQVQLATLNILEDFEIEKRRIEETQRATFNILEDFDVQQARTEGMQRATFNILEDFDVQQARTEGMQRATFNILDDLQTEKAKLERTERELAKRADDLARSNADLERFAHVVSHDLQEPLRTITGYVQLLQQETQGKLEPEAARFMQSSLDGTARMKAMIVDILSFARAGKADMKMEDIGLEDIFAGALANLEQLVADKAAKVTHDPLPTVQCDRSLMGQVLQNLISNGLKFHGPEPPRVHVGARRDGDQWLLSVRDNGIGIDAKDLHRLFVPFQRLHSVAQFPGSGIGLANCRRILERHGGRIWLESEPGQGTTFLFTLPAAPA